MAGERHNRLFGTDGIRGVAGEFPLDDSTVELIGASLVENLAGELGRPPRMVVGRDTRLSGPQIEAALARGARSAGGSVSLAGVMTTPGIAFITRDFGFDAGVVISASHNPYRDNGIKVFSPSGKKLDDETERRVEADIEARAGRVSTPRGAFDGAGEPDPRFQGRYIDFLVRQVGGGVGLEGMRLGLDCSNGAASGIAPEVFERLGATIKVICASPDGRNINENCGSLHPENLKELVRSCELDLGIAFDGDADRALFVDSQGNMIDGDQVLFILASRMKSQGSLSGDLVVATVMSNIGLEISLRERGISLVRAQVGDRFVLERLLALGARLGGEQSGHIIFPDISLAGDGIITAIEVLRAVVAEGRPLGMLASEMVRFPQVLVNVKVRSKPPLETIPEIQREIERIERDMQGRGRLLVRYSGTENLARVMIEGEQQERIEEQANHLAE
ncbi:MAG TPA: phosphoglucosamine mutase, partial [Blastocatellia bacterium]|nr:phosphoglucosamine mutase [Blastocatellia bacterium]